MQVSSSSGAVFGVVVAGDGENKSTEKLPGADSAVTQEALG